MKRRCPIMEKACKRQECEVWSPEYQNVKYGGKIVQKDFGHCGLVLTGEIEEVKEELESIGDALYMLLEEGIFIRGGKDV